MYTCPMHPEIKSSKSGTCPKCNMMLVTVKDLKIEKEENSFTPFFIIIGLILITSLAISFKDFQVSNFVLNSFLSNFMAGFFIVFAGFKLLDLKGFADGYFTYDLLAKRWYTYGYIYPFIELFFGLSMILNFMTREVLIAEIIVMTFSGFGVLIKLLKKEKFSCACLGTFFKLPLTKVTLIEDFGMAVLALVLLFNI